MKYNTNIIYIKRKLGGGDVMKHKYNLPKFLHANLPEGVKPFFYGLAGRASLLCGGAVCQLVWCRMYRIIMNKIVNKRKT